MELKNKDELAAELGTRLIEDADKIRLFMPDHAGRFGFKWNGALFQVIVHMDEGGQ